MLSSSLGYLAGSEVFSIPIVAVVFAFIYLTVRLQTREREARLERERKYRLLEKALESGAIDEATKRRLVETVARPEGAAGPPGGSPAVVLGAIGWIGIFVGAALLVVGYLGEEDLMHPGMLVALISFGLVSVPFALRELNARKA